MLVQPRLGVSSTIPFLVSSGPGDPMPTPSTFFPDSLIDAFAGSTSRAVPRPAPGAAVVGPETPPSAAVRPPAGAAAPRCVRPRAVAGTERPHPLDGGEHGRDGQLPHATMMAQQPGGRAMRRA